MLLIRTKDGLAPWRGEPLTRMVAERTVHYLDGRSETESCEPYPLQVTGMAPGKVEALIRDGVWGANDLADHRLSWAAPFVVPEKV